MKINRGRQLLTLAILELAAWIVSGQNWYEVSMTPDQDTLVLQSFDAMATNGFTGPILSVNLAALAAGLLTAGKSRSLIFSIASFSSLGLTILAAINVSQQNLAGVAKQIESATGIAATHGLTGVEVTTLISAPIGVGIYALLAIGFGYAAATSKFWQKRVAKVNQESNKKGPTDSISMWDQQR